MCISYWSSDVFSSVLGCVGISIFIQVMTVKRQSRLQSQAITRTKTDRLYLFEGAQFIGKSRDGFGRQADFKAIFTSVSCSADPPIMVTPSDRSRLHQYKLVNARTKP